ncbi:hypothetical protein D5086_015366, partial [Populus alba]
EEKQESQGNHVWDPIRCGTSFSVEKVSFWRDFVKLFAHHVFHTPAKPAGLMYHKTVGKLDGSGHDLSLGNCVRQFLNCGKTFPFVKFLR